MLYSAILTTFYKADNYNSFVLVIKTVSFFEIGRDGAGSRTLKLIHKKLVNQKSGMPFSPTPLRRKSTDSFATMPRRIGRCLKKHLEMELCDWVGSLRGPQLNGL